MQWNVFGSSSIANIGNRTPATSCRSRSTGGGSSAAGATDGGTNVTPSADISPIVAAGVLSGAAPFGFLIGTHDRRRRRRPTCIINALEQKGVARSAGRAEPGGAVRRHRELPRRRRISDPGARLARHRSPSTTRTTASASPSRRPCSSGGLINLKIEPEVSQLDTSHTGHGRAASRCRR